MREQEKKGEIMDVVYELEEMRRRVLQEINAEFDIMIRRMEDGLRRGELHTGSASRPYESKHSLTVGTRMFKGKKPTSVTFESGESASVMTWKQLVEAVLKDCIREPRYKNALLALRGRVAGKTRVILSEVPESMRSPLKIDEKLYMETHYDTETLLNVLMSRVLNPIGYDCSKITVTIITV